MRLRSARSGRERRLSCLKRSTIGSFLLGVLEEPWQSYTAFHLETVRCLMCRANLDDLAAESARLGARNWPSRCFNRAWGFFQELNEFPGFLSGKCELCGLSTFPYLQASLDAWFFRRRGIQAK